jgi:pimeloyl-ACP methyl ester carboxylesterase
MTSISNLYAKFRYAQKTYESRLPILILVHGWGGDGTSFDGDDTLTRMANYGFFVASVGMRGRNLADGSRDASGREIHDIYDLLAYVRATYPTIVSQDIACLYGLSGGGGNVLAAACKFPDAWNVVVSQFGMSDYGRDGTNGWYNNASSPYPAEIAASIGDTPTNVPDRYYARDATVAIQNYSGGYLYLYHDKQDTLVPWVHSNRIKLALDAAGLSNYSANFSDAGDSPRWLHGYPKDVPDLKLAEPTWTATMLAQADWTVPESGTVTVIGYIVTKRFSIWLNSGVDSAATVVYDTAAGTYTVTPLTSNAVAVTITQGVLSASGNANGATLFTVA